MFNSNCASVPLVASIDGGYGGNSGFLNGDGLWGLIIILALLGWGGNGFGGGFGGFGGNRDCGCNPCATQADVRAAVDQQTLISKLDQQTYGLADSTYALNNGITTGFAGVQQTLCQGFNGVNTAILQSANGTERGFANLSSQLASCCCETGRAIERGFADTNYNMATQACDIKHAINDSTRSILDFLTTDKIATLQAENQNLKLRASQAEQNAYLLNELKPCPSPAYVVQPPTQVTFPVNTCGQFAGYGYNNGCGCGCA